MTELAVRNAAPGLMNIKKRKYKTQGDDGPSKFKQISRFIFTEDVLTRFKRDDENIWIWACWEISMQ